MFKKWSIVFGLCLLILALISACGDPETKKMKFFERGKELYLQGDYVNARLEFKNALQLDPAFADGYYMLGLSLVKTKDFKNAYGSLKKAVELKPDHIDAQLQLGKLLFMAGTTDKAIEKAEVVLAMDPDNSGALMLKAAVLLRRGDTAAATDILEGLQAKDITDPEVYMLTASALIQNLDLQRAEKTYLYGISANPDSIPLHLTLVKFYRDNRRNGDAANILQKVIELQPDDPTHQFTLADLYWEEGKRPEAADLIAGIIEADPANDMNRVRAARFYMSKQQFDQAEQLLKQGLEQSPKSYEIRLVLADLFMRWQRPDAAIDVLKACLELDEDPATPGIIKAKNALAKIYLARRQIDEAEKFTNEVLVADPKSVDGHFNRGSIYLIRGDGTNAVSEFRTVINERPGYVRGYLRLAQAHVLNQEIELAEDTLQNALKADPDSKAALRALARVYALKLDRAATEAQLRKIVALDPSDITSRADLGDFLLAVKNYEDAANEYRAIQKLVSQHPLGYLKMSRFYLKQNNPDAALDELEKGYKKNPASKQLLNALVQGYCRSENCDAAVRLCQKRIEQNPEDAFTYNLLAVVHFGMKNYPEAEAALEKTIDLQPTWVTPHANLVNLYLVQGKKQEAIKKFEAAIDDNPQNGPAYISLALLYEHDKDYANAMSVYERALEANPNFWFAANNLAFLLSEYDGQPAALKRARALAEGALKNRPNDPFILDTLAWIFFQMDDYKQARAVMEEAIAAAPDTAIFNYHMGMVLYKSGQKEAARERLKKALEGDEEFIGRDVAEATLKKLS